MYPWLWFWAPQVHYPWSASVAQQIDPSTSWFFDGIRPSAGNASVERRAFDVASYGRQLGLITEVLLELAETAGALSPAAATSAARLRAIQAAIENLKADEFELTAQQIESQIERLASRDTNESERLRQRLKPLLLRDAGA